MARREPEPEHLRASGAAVVLAREGGGVPAIAYWGEDLGAAAPAESLEGLALAQLPQPVSGDLDVPGRLSTVPLESQGWLGTSELTGSRGGQDFSPRFRVTDRRTEADDTGTVFVVELSDDDARLDLERRFALDDAPLPPVSAAHEPRRRASRARLAHPHLPRAGYRRLADHDSELDDDRVYEAALLPLPGAGNAPLPGARGELAWERTGLTMTDRTLRVSALRPPVLHPEELALIELIAR